MALRVLAILLSVILTSGYFFPFNFLSNLNTKMFMAGVALALLGIRLAKNRDAKIDKDLFVLSLWGIGVSLASIIATTYNSTQDYSYLSYVVSMWVWMGGAYTLIKCIEWLNGRITLELVCDCIIAACVMQCTLAFLIDQYPWVANVANMICPGLRGIEKYTEGRLYGIGCAFDVAGIRLACGVTILAFMTYRHIQKPELPKYRIIWYFISFVIITVFGNMISRTTLMGCILYIVYFIGLIMFGSNQIANRRLVYCLLLCIIIAIPCVTFMYNTNPAFHSYLRFGFEGFFSLVEKGEWDVQSNEVLWTMYRFPETLKTWIIGDGYMLSAEYDPYYTGPIYLGFYKGTDVGYIRFLYYFGLIGLIPIVMQMITATSICFHRLPAYRIISISLLLVNLICWFKVTTDAFSAIAIFVVYSMMNLQESKDYIDDKKM